MTDNAIVSREEWIEARKAFLAEEKQFTKMRDDLSRKRRALPWVKVEKNYQFEGPDGTVSLADLFDGRSQLIVYHFMYGPEWTEGCPSCTFWADGYNGAVVHMNQRDVSLALISRAPLENLLAYRQRMGWAVNWVSSLNNDFNQDYHVSFTPDEMASDGVNYNYRETKFPSEEAPGISVFMKLDNGDIVHTYSCYARGLDMMNVTYQHLDLVPKGRDEDGLPYPMAWVRRKDQYEG